VYKPEAEIDPHADPMQPGPVTVQWTDVFVLPLTVAENCCVPFTLIWTPDGATDTDTAVAGTMVTAAETDLVVSATDLAVTVTEPDEGTVAGAV